MSRAFGLTALTATRAGIAAVPREKLLQSSDGAGFTLRAGAVKSRVNPKPLNGASGAPIPPSGGLIALRIGPLGCSCS